MNKNFIQSIVRFIFLFGCYEKPNSINLMFSLLTHNYLDYETQYIVPIDFFLLFYVVLEFEIMQFRKILDNTMPLLLLGNDAIEPESVVKL